MQIRRKWIFVWLCSVSCLLLSAFSPNFSVTQGGFEIREAVTTDHVLEGLKQTDKLRNGADFQAALANARETLGLAEELGESRELYLLVASAHLESLRCLDNQSVIESLLCRPEELEDAEPELRLVYYAALLQTKIWFDSNHSDYPTILAEYELAAKQSNLKVDSYLRVQQKALSTYVRTFEMLEDVNSDSIEAARKQLSKISTGTNDPLPKVISLMILARQQKKLRLKGSAALSAETLKEALEIAKGGKCGWLKIRCHELLCNTVKPSKDKESSIAFRKDTVRASAAYGTKLLETRHTRTLARLLQNSNPEESMRLLEHLEDNIGAPLINALNDISEAHIAAKLDDREKFKQVKSGLPSSGKMGELYANRKIADLANQRIQTVQKHSRETVAAKTATIQYLTYLTWGLSALFLLTMLGLLVAKIRKTNAELTSQRETTRQSQEQCEELSLRIGRLQRMESLGLMAGSVAHDFNNILVGVLGNAEVIRMKKEIESDSDQDSHRQTECDKFVDERLGSIIASAEKAASLSRQMIAYAGKQEIKRLPIDLNELIAQFGSILQSTCKNPLAISHDFSRDPVVTKVDVTQIEQVILNLVTNAVEAIPDDGRISIKTGFESLKDEEIENDHSLHGTRTAGGDFCFIEVNDNGTGVKQDDLERIFEPFFSRSGIGRGLGLSVVYGCVTGHEGFIRCQSEVGVGTSFRILLPVSREKAVAEFNQSPSANNVQDMEEFNLVSGFDLGEMDLKIGKVLVIDDEETVLDMCRDAMDLNGWQVMTALGGEIGIRMATEHADELACILLDVVMPDMGANEILKELEASGIDTPIVLMSGFSDTHLEVFRSRPNVVTILSKPFRTQDIFNAIVMASHASQKYGYVVTSTRDQNGGRPK